MAEIWGRDLKPPVDGFFIKFLGMEPFLGITISKSKLMHGKPLCNAYMQFDRIHVELRNILNLLNYLITFNQ